MNVWAAVLKGGEQEAHVRRRDHPVRVERVKIVFTGGIAQARLGLLHRAHRAQHVAEHGFALRARGFIIHRGFERHVVGVVQNENQEIALDARSGDDRVEKRVQRLVVVQRRLVETGQARVRRAVHHLVGGEGQRHEVASHVAGQRAAENLHVFFAFALRKRNQRAAKRGNHVLLAVYIAAADDHGVLALRVQAAANLRNVFFVHFNVLI